MSGRAWFRRWPKAAALLVAEGVPKSLKPHSIHRHKTALASLRQEPFMDHGPTLHERRGAPFDAFASAKLAAKKLAVNPINHVLDMLISFFGWLPTCK